MRLGGQQKLGYYAFPPEAMSLALTHLRRAEGVPAVLDPCAGEGAALAALADHLAIPPGPHVGAVELDGARAEVIRARLPGANVLGPASLFGCRISWGWSLVWLNAPFDDVLGGGGREEDAFLVKATALLKPGGILAMVVPAPRVTGYANTIPRHLDTWYDHSFAYRLPYQMRKYREVVVFGVKRKQPRDISSLTFEEKDLLTWVGVRFRGGTSSWAEIKDYHFGELGQGGNVWPVPAGDPPRVFLKTEYTPDELAAAVDASPVSSAVREPAPRRRRRPPLALNEGHIAILLASGHLDGILRPEGEPPMVVRGTERKVEYVKECETTESDDGTVTTKRVKSERPTLTIRYVDVAGEIHTLEQ